VQKEDLPFEIFLQGGKSFFVELLQLRPFGILELRCRDKIPEPNEWFVLTDERQISAKDKS
jgi:hypothetical protein